MQFFIFGETMGEYTTLHVGKDKLEVIEEIKKENPHMEHWKFSKVYDAIFWEGVKNLKKALIEILSHDLNFFI